MSLMLILLRIYKTVAFHNLKACSVVEALFHFIPRVGILKEILTDQDTSFMKQTSHKLYVLLGIKSICTSICHPMLKSMICKFIQDNVWNWDKWLEPLLFTTQEVPQVSTGFSPFELLYGWKPQGIIDAIQETGRRSLLLLKMKFNMFLA